jgi:hypothetical protein
MGFLPKGSPEAEPAFAPKGRPMEEASFRRRHPERRPARFLFPAAVRRARGAVERISLHSCSTPGIITD